jgi:phosphate transport system substrate-binding protein
VNYHKTTRLTALLALLIVAFSLAACGGDNATPTTTSGGATTANTPATSMTNTQAMAANTPATGMMTGTQMMGTPGMMMTNTQTMSSSGGAASGNFTPIEGGATTLSGGGATFPDILYQKWFAEYAKTSGVKVNYQAKGSGFGVQNIQQQTLDFGGSDAPMSNAELAAAKGGPILHIPTTLGAVVPTYNIPGYTGDLKLSGDTLAKIYLGTIKDWSDPAITADNGTALPAGPIQVVYRSDSSGTTFVWTSYLADVSSEWKAGPGANKSPHWPTGQGAPGNAGVAGQVKSTPFSIGYVEIAFAKQNNLSSAAVKNKNGKFVKADLPGITAAAANIGSLPDDLRFSLINNPGDETYPITSGTWQLVYKNQTDKAKAIALVNLLNWELTVGQGYNEGLFYGKLPSGIVAKAQGLVKTINVNGTPVQP